MNIAFIVCPEQPCPPPNYGGMERVSDIMIRKIIEKGHTVDLYCGEGSTCPATNLLTTKNSMRNEVDLFNKFCKNRKKYDVVIDFTANHLVGQNFSTMVISLMGGDPFKKYPHNEVYNKVYKSKEFAKFNNNPDAPYIYNVIEYDPQSIPLGKGQGNYALYVGTIVPMKGIQIAAEACKNLGMNKLKVYGPIRDQEYYNTFKDDVEYCGLLGSEGRDKVFGDAIVFVHPVQCCDCDPLAPKEAMLRGTSVIATRVGGLIESIEEGVSGYFASSVKKFEEQIIKAKILNINRQKVRDSILSKVDSDKITDELLVLCERVNNGETW